MLNFLPGEPNKTIQTICHKTWKRHTILAYCSGNNLIILSNRFTKLQTIYFDNDATAVDISEISGLIAIAVGNVVHIYEPLHNISKDPKWVASTTIFHDESRVNCLEWTLNDEIVVGSDYLSLWKFKSDINTLCPYLLWTQRHPTPVYRCLVSQDAQLIATLGKYDKKLKVWRRISNAGDHVLFDLTLIPHVGYVTMFRWRKVESETQPTIHILYTLCSDYNFRIWSNFDNENKNNVQNWGTIQLDKGKGERFALVIDNWILERTIPKDSSKPFLNYLSDNHVEMVGIISTKGLLRVIALENLSEDPPRIVNITELKTVKLNSSWFTSNPKFLYFAEPRVFDNSVHKISIIIHDLRGSIKHLLISVDKLFEQNSVTNVLEHKFTGHNKSIQKLQRSSDGEAVLTISRFDENSLWVPQPLHSGISLKKRSSILTTSPVYHALVHEKGALVITLLRSYKLQAWDCSSVKSKVAALICETEINSERGYPLLMIATPEKKHNHECHFVSLLYSTGHVECYKVTNSAITQIQSNKIQVDDDDGGTIYLASAIDPVQHTFFSDRNLVATISSSGLVRTHKALVAADQSSIVWKVSHEMNTNIKNSSRLSGSSFEKICIVDSTRKVFSIWDINKDVVECEYNFETPILDIDWTSTRMGQSIVSIGFDNHVILFTQLRYDYTNKLPSFSPIKKIEIAKHTTHRIGDSTWLKDGTIVVASGNQLFIEDKQLDLTDNFTVRSIGSRWLISDDILHLSSVLNGPLPVYHPQFLIQALYFGKIKLTKGILLRLFSKLRQIEFNPDLRDALSSNLDLNYGNFIMASEKNYVSDTAEDACENFDSNVSSRLRETLTKVMLPYLTRNQQKTLITVVEALEEMSKNERSVDFSGLLFILGLKLFIAHMKTQPSVTMRDVAWALHSENKQVLLSLIDSDLNSWSRAKQYRISYWATEEDLKRKFEHIAKFEFAVDGTNNPFNCAIFYLALKKKNVLLGLWKISSSHPEGAKMLKFLKNDFSEPRWRTAALKNAFVLVSKHRYLDAACFFLIANSLKDAVNVLVTKVNDLDLAIGVCRVYEGDNGPELYNMLIKYVLPAAIEENDGWTSTFVFWKLRKRALAIKSLLMSPLEFSSDFEGINKDLIVNKSYLMEDPALLHLYLQLRKKKIDYFKGSLEINENTEYNIIKKVANIYFRMGCEYLSLSLLRNWDFTEKRKMAKTQNVDLREMENKMLEQGNMLSGGSHPNMFQKSEQASYSASFNDTSSPRNILDEYMNQKQSPRSKVVSLSITHTSDNPASSRPPRQASTPRNLLDEYMN
ncbi:HDL133Wp [Eremothecium sinecaudum]|uniref:HDL133Wp n=1 Tax=Eremothecium sinecaudum TaxID=45286 RepID=A0A109UZ22_9SACH|nr:HDL133Wp [Eremothecium sinecaudum]AMD20611.1 HDL133Wp [Eremothecium sinecaudum]